MLMLIFFLTNAYNLQRNTANITSFEFCYCMTEYYYYQCILPITHAPTKLLEGGSQCISFSGIQNFPLLNLNVPYL